MAKQKETGSFFQRTLIILFSAAIVVLGLDPIRREHGGIVNYLRDTSSALAKTAQSKSLDLPKPRIPGETNTKPDKPKQLDRLTEEDKKELDAFINRL